MSILTFYTVLQSAIDGDTLLIPVRVRHVENARITVVYNSIYSSAANNIQSY